MLFLYTWFYQPFKLTLRNLKFAINHAFALNYRNANKKGLLFVEQPLVLSGASPLSSPKVKFFEHLVEFLESLERILNVKWLGTTLNSTV